MKAYVKLGDDVKLEIEEQNEMEILHKAIVLSSPRRQCNVCHNTEGFYFTTNKDKEGNIYVNYKCPKCGARSKLGQYKTKGYFWRDFEKYERPQVTSHSRPTEEEPPLEEYDQIPF